jgi:NAD(P)-dependent dehydrogenase (short-subunit alcohol dehydrogenase family)
MGGQDGSAFRVDGERATEEDEMESEKGKRAVLVTGASTGIGRATALMLDKIGYPVFASVRKTQDGDKLREAASPKLKPVLMDVTDEAAIARAADEIAAQVGGSGLWGLVNNAGISFRAPLEFAPLNEFRRLYESNVFGLLAVTQAFLPLLRQTHGRIVNVSSLTALMVTPFHGIYSSSKMAVNGITEALRLEVKPHGVKVSLMIYGGVRTELWDRVAKMTADITNQCPPEFNSLYASGLKKALDYFTTRGRSGLTPEEAAQPIIHALTAENPKRTYYVGGDAKFSHMLSKVVPGKLRDRLILGSIGLDK